MVQKITRSLMCCVLFAMSVVASFAADKLMIVGDAVWGGWTPANSVVMLPDGENVFKATVYLKKIDGETVKEGFKLLTAAKWDCYNIMQVTATLNLKKVWLLSCMITRRMVTTRNSR